MDWFAFGDKILFYSTFVILAASIVLSVKTRFIQFRMLPRMFSYLGSLLFSKKMKIREGKSTIKAHHALFTAMSTTIGISTIVSPVIAIKLGGPGAIIGFLIATGLGAAVNFCEVSLSLSYRKKNSDGTIAGGPMQYLKDEIAPFLAKWYAFFTFLLMMVWSAAQSNQLASILNSPLLGKMQIPTYVTGAIVAICMLVLLIGGIKRVANFSAKIVPVMFALYVGAGLWIVALNIDQLLPLFKLIIKSAFVPQTFFPGAAIGGIVSAFRWGVFKGLHTTEVGLGTQTIPHSMAETSEEIHQGTLAMVSTFSAAFIWILSALIALMTEKWLDPSVTLGINMMAASFHDYFSLIGMWVIAISAFLFGFGTILGNGYNGQECFSFLSNRRYFIPYYVVSAIIVFVGSILDVAFVWSIVDYFVIPVVLPHILSVVYISFKRKEHISISTTFSSEPVS